MKYLVDPSKGPPYQYIISFSEMQWTAIGIDTIISLTFSTLLQHGTNISSFSQRINVENRANSLDFISDPPAIVSVNSIFPVELYVTSKGGYPLPNALVACNVTKALDLSKMSSEVFTSLANSNFNIQKSSFLAPASKLDPERTVTRSDSKGIAKLYLRVKESPLDSKVRIVCQSGRTMSSPSTKIKIEHTIRKITQEVKNMTEKVKVPFNKNSEGFKSKFKSDIFRNKGDFEIHHKTKPLGTRKHRRGHNQRR
jgi:hypothetical protein